MLLSNFGDKMLVFPPKVTTGNLVPKDPEERPWERA